NDGLVYQKRSEREVDSYSYGASVSGPLIKDRLYLYASGEIERQSQVGVLARPGGATNGYQASDYNIPRWMAKIDWNITDNHIVELTAISDVTKNTVDYFPYSYEAGTNETERGYNKTGGYTYRDGGELYIGKYTGYLTDNLTLTALYGEQNQDHIAEPFGY